MLSIWSCPKICCLVNLAQMIEMLDKVLEKEKMLVRLHNFTWYSLTLSKWQILDSSKIKDFADDNFEFNENGRKFSKRVENTLEKGEIACCEQFLLLPQCFQKDLYHRHVKTRACLGKG